MRILLAIDHYPPIIGGAQIQSMVLAKSLHERGHEVVVATVWQHGVPAIETDDGLPIYRLRQLRTLPGIARRWRHHQPPFPDPVTVVGFRRLIARIQAGHRPFIWLVTVIRALPRFREAHPAGADCTRLCIQLRYANALYKGRACAGPALTKCLDCAGSEYGRPKGWITTFGVLGCAPLLLRKIRAVHSISAYVETIMRRDFIDDRDSTAETPSRDSRNHPRRDRGSQRPTSPRDRPPRELGLARARGSSRESRSYSSSGRSGA